MTTLKELIAESQREFEKLLQKKVYVPGYYDHRGNLEGITDVSVDDIKSFLSSALLQTSLEAKREMCERLMNIIEEAQYKPAYRNPKEMADHLKTLITSIINEKGV